MSEPKRDIYSKVRIVDPLRSVRSHPEWFFQNGTFTAAEALSRLMSEALIHGSTDVSVRQIDGWWVLASSNDWLRGDVQTFFFPAPDPQRGPNTSRVEVALTAFCRSVVTATHGSRYDVVASANTPPPPVSAGLDDESWARVVAFLPPTATTSAPSDGDRASVRPEFAAESMRDLALDFEQMLDALPSKVAALTGQAGS